MFVISFTLGEVTPPALRLAEGIAPFFLRIPMSFQEHLVWCGTPLGLRADASLLNPTLLFTSFHFGGPFSKLKSGGIFA